MNLLKHTALAAYYTASLPLRSAQQRARHRQGQEPISILFYHRVADQHPNAWTMSTDDFARQIDWIQRHRDVVSLSEAQRRVASGHNARPTVCLTFDDGYADNCDFALPLLIRRGLPVTYFVSSDHVLGDLPFPHDVAAGVSLRPNTLSELRAMADAGVEIGAHTRTHADLGKIVDDDLLVAEIAGSKQDLEQALGKPVPFFAFPFGLHENLSARAFQVAHQAGFAGVCSAYGAYNLPGDDPFHLQRIHADPELVRLKNWLTVDPRKRSIQAYDPGDYRQRDERPLFPADENQVGACH